MKELTKYQRQASWPASLNNYTEDVRYFKNRWFLCWSNTFSGISCCGESGIIIRYNGSIPIGCAFIKENGDVDKYWTRVGQAVVNGEKVYVLDYEQEQYDQLVMIFDGGDHVEIKTFVPNNSYYLGGYDKYKREDREEIFSMPTLDF